MKLFIDSANLEEIKTAASWGIINGVTTNPTLVAREGGDFRETIREICKIVNGPVSAEILSLEADEMVREARQLADWHKNVTIKIPCTPEGLKAAKALARFKIKTNVTLVFSANQVLAAAKAGATFISLFVGRLDDAGEDGLAVVEESLKILKNYDFKSELIVASVRSPLTVQRVAVLGAHIATVPYKVLEQMLKHSLTDAGIERFLKDWESVKKSK